jgi:hypothetical protein
MRGRNRGFSLTALCQQDMCGFAFSACFDFKLEATKASQEIVKLFREIHRSRFILVNATLILLAYFSEANFHHSKTSPPWIAYCFCSSGGNQAGLLPTISR